MHEKGQILAGCTLGVLDRVLNLTTYEIITKYEIIDKNDIYVINTKEHSRTII
jgi:hypothetical protein